MKEKVSSVLYLILMSRVTVQAFEPAALTMVGAGVAALGNKLYKYMFNTCNQPCNQPCDEPCDEHCIGFNATGLKMDLQRKLFGQHVASRVILKAVTGFMTNKNPKKPLVLSLHGWTGTGKSFASQLIAENIYQRGLESGFVHLFAATVHFPHEEKLELYKSQLQQWIKGNVSACSRSMFIFDEMEKMPPGLIDSIRPYLDFHRTLDGVSYRKSIFIFLSNAGGENIMQVALDFWKAGRDREEIELRDLETTLILSVLNNKKSGIWPILVDFFVPFLPLEYEHVVQCGRAEMINKGLQPNEKALKQMAHDMNYFPRDERVFSMQGCRFISNRLDFYI